MHQLLGALIMALAIFAMARRGDLSSSRPLDLAWYCKWPVLSRFGSAKRG
jgi:hypothetical protein